MGWETSKHKGSTRESRRIRAQVLAQHPTCYLGFPGCTQASTEDDHIIPLSQGGTDHPSNHAGACHHCHGIKTQREAAAARERARALRGGIVTHRQRPTESHPGITG